MTHSYGDNLQKFEERGALVHVIGAWRAICCRSAVQWGKCLQSSLHSVHRPPLGPAVAASVVDSGRSGGSGRSNKGEVGHKTMWSRTTSVCVVQCSAMDR